MSSRAAAISDMDCPTRLGPPRVRTPFARVAIAAVAAIAPQRLKHLIYRTCFGWSVHPSARIGASFICVDHLVVEAGVIVSKMNVIKGCELVHLGANAEIGAWNWISGVPRRTGMFPNSPDRRPHFILGKSAEVVTRHYIQCNDEVRIGDYGVLGGLHSRVLTHGPDLVQAVQRTAPVSIGERALVTSNCTLLSGSVIPARSVVAAGATVAGRLGDELWLYGGLPARPIKPLPDDLGFLTRVRGRMD